MFNNTNEASMALFNKLKRHDKCDVCGEVKDVVTAASLFGGSYSYCMNCLNKGAEPYRAMVDYIACAGHYPEDISLIYQAFCQMTLNALNIPEEQFIKDVDDRIESMWRV